MSEQDQLSPSAGDSSPQPEPPADTAGGQQASEGAASTASDSPASSFPVATLDEALPELRRPFTAAAVKWKVQPKAGGLVVPYVDARLVIERLNTVVGAGWMDTYEQFGGGLLCRLSIDGITRQDFSDAYGTNGKGRISDAFKRTAVKFGVGVSLYALRKVWLKAGDSHLEEKSRKTKSGTEKYFVLTDNGLEYLRTQYQRWLDSDKNGFGKALDHGDEADAIGDFEADAPASSEGAQDEPAAAKLTDERGVELITRAEELYAKLPAPRRRGDLNKANFERRLKAAWHSHEELEGLVTMLEERADAS